MTTSDKCIGADAMLDEDKCIAADAMLDDDKYIDADAMLRDNKCIATDALTTNALLQTASSAFHAQSTTVATARGMELMAKLVGYEAVFLDTAL